MKVVHQRDVPRRNFCPAAEIRLDFDALARRLGVRPHQGKVRVNSTSWSTYRTVWFALSTGRYANLSQIDSRPSVIEFSLELQDDEYFHEDDLLELIAGIGIDPDYVKRFQNDFAWIRSPSAGGGG
ncbi:MAG: hypothetical protein IPM99_18090 [Rubrivivax sp.]|nr:hypothetical protein [Rubrivivax sp.]